MSVFIPAPRKDTFIVSNMRHKNFGDSDTIFVGTSSSMAVFRSLLKFEMKSIPSKALISSANLRLYVKRNDYPDTSKTVDLFRLTDRFHEDKIRWKTQPELDPTLEAFVEVSSETGVYIQWDITSLIQRWRSKECKNRGIMLKVRDESQRSLLAFDSRESPIFDRRPSIVVNLQEPAQSMALSSRLFFSDVQRNLLSADSFQYSFPRDISTVTFNTFFIQNRGSNPALVVVQISPDNTSSTWVDDSSTVLVNPGQNLPITSTHMVKWTRLAYQSANPGNPTSLDIWFQAET